MTDLEFDVAAGVAVITLNRPARGNSLTYEMIGELLPGAWRRAEADPDVGAIVLTAAGERAFCSGADTADDGIVEMMTGKRPPIPMRISARHNAVSKPVVVAVNGACSGGGLMLAADSDIAIASPNASFTNHGPALGIAANIGAAVWAASGRLPWALRLSLLGASGSLGAEEALRYGAVGEIVPADELRAHAIGLASSIVAGSPAVIRSAKQTLWQASTLGVDEAMALAEREANEFSGHPDALEARRARQENRAPVWSQPGPGGTDA